MDVAQRLVRSSEDVTVAIAATAAPRDLTEDDKDEDGDSDGMSDLEAWPGAEHWLAPRRKVLAVFAHVNASGTHQQGWCVAFFSLRVLDRVLGRGSASWAWFPLVACLFSASRGAVGG